ncbi:hypothetical protein PInf_010535 [Phytophthora infestans]|nr:hypothetical protein PInf_010535 [Phytophthora infestans]
MTASSALEGPDVGNDSEAVPACHQTVHYAREEYGRVFAGGVNSASAGLNAESDLDVVTECRHDARYPGGVFARAEVSSAVAASSADQHSVAIKEYASREVLPLEGTKPNDDPATSDSALETLDDENSSDVVRQHGVDATYLGDNGDHFIETLGDVDLADRLILLRLPDADELEEVLRAVDRAKHRQKKAAVGSGKYRQKAQTPTAPARRVHQVTAPDSGTKSGSDGSDSDPEDYRRVCLTASNDRSAKTGDNSRPRDTVPGDRGMYRSRDLMDGTAQVRCSQCGSRKHTESGCWKHLVCEKCGKKGHPGDHSFYVCRGCGEIHDVGKCPMEEFYNQIRQWFDPAKHRGMLPEVAEKMLN